MTFKVEAIESGDWELRTGDWESRIETPIHTHHIPSSIPNFPQASPVLKIRFQIEDMGIGMSSDQLEKIFLPFEQVGENKRKTEGTGLGLAISQKLAQIVGSSIQVKSQAGVGSIFWLDVDVSESKEWVRSPSLASQEKIVGFIGSQRKILVVDDTEENR